MEGTLEASPEGLRARPCRMARQRLCSPSEVRARPGRGSHRLRIKEHRAGLRGGERTAQAPPCTHRVER